MKADSHDNRQNRHETKHKGTCVLNLEQKKKKKKAENDLWFLSRPKKLDAPTIFDLVDHKSDQVAPFGAAGSLASVVA